MTVDHSLEEEYMISSYHYRCWQYSQEAIRRKIQLINEEEAKRNKIEEKRKLKLVQLEEQLKKIEEEKKSIDNLMKVTADERLRLMDPDYTEDEEEELEIITIDDDNTRIHSNPVLQPNLSVIGECPITRSLIATIRKMEFKPVFEKNNNDWFRMNETDTRYVPSPLPSIIVPENNSHFLQNNCVTYSAN
jgi:hypothetical protein